MKWRKQRRKTGLGRLEWGLRGRKWGSGSLEGAFGTENEVPACRKALSGPKMGVGRSRRAFSGPKMGVGRSWRPFSGPKEPCQWSKMCLSGPKASSGKPEPGLAGPTGSLRRKEAEVSGPKGPPSRGGRRRAEGRSVYSPELMITPRNCPLPQANGKANRGRPLRPGASHFLAGQGRVNSLPMRGPTLSPSPRPSPSEGEGDASPPVRESTPSGGSSRGRRGSLSQRERAGVRMNSHDLPARLQESRMRPWRQPRCG